MIELKKPIELLSDPRNDGGDAVCSAKTISHSIGFTFPSSLPAQCTLLLSGNKEIKLVQ